MENTTIIYSSLSLILVFFSLNLLFCSKRRHRNLPPSPPAVPILGHLHIIKRPPHRGLYRLSQDYGPILSLRLGSRPVVLVSSASAAQECFTKNDVVLANRPTSLAGEHIGYNYTNMVSSPYGDHWRNLRRIAAIEVFSTGRINTFHNIRKDEIRRLLLKLSETSRHSFAKVELKSMFVDLMFNNIMRMVAGKRYYGDDVKNEEEAKQFKELIAELFRKGVQQNLADFLPLIRFLDFGKREGTLKRLGRSIDGFLQALVDEKRCKKEGNTMIDHLLSLQKSEPEYYTDQIIKGFIMIMILAGTDTSAVTLEWAMANLLNHPNVMKRAKAELDVQLGQRKLIEEPDIPKLPYLQSIIWETLRLYPAAPLLLPHYSSSDCTIGGYTVPRGTTVLVNAWAIHRDPTSWDDPTSFKPERFEKKEKESHKLLPFGLGRRACPGEGLAQRMLSLTLASLIQCFEWERESAEAVDMTEGARGNLQKAEPLEAMCKARPIVNEILYAAT